MMRISLMVFFSFVFAVDGTLDYLQAAEPAAVDTNKLKQLSEAYRQNVRPTLMKYCADCHSPDDNENPVQFLSAISLEQVANDRSLWGSVAEQLRNRTMPPADEPQPAEQQKLQIATWIDETLYLTASLQGPYAGVVTTRRLNRTEYENTIRDLLGVETNVSDTFPVDGSGGEGFDNNGETLFLPTSPLKNGLLARITDEVFI